MSTRTRMSAEQRRVQLLDLGGALFARQPYDEVLIDDIAEQAGISRGLMYHYFPTKRAFFAAIVGRQVTQMSEVTRTDPDDDLGTQLRVGIRRYLEYCRENPHAISAIHSGSASGDPEVRALIDHDLETQTDRIVTIAQPDGEVHPMLRLVVRGWLSMLATVGDRAATRWAAGDPAPGLDDLVDTCAGALIGAVLALPEPLRPDWSGEIAGTGA